MAIQHIPFATQSYPLDNSVVSQEKLINLYLEPQPQGARSAFVVRNTPGLLPFSDLGAAPVYAMAVQRTEVYAVSGNGLFRIGADGLATLAGSWESDGSPYFATIACSDREVMVCVPPKIYLLKDSGEFLLVTRADMPPASSVSYLDGRFIISEMNSGRLWWSDLYNGSVFGPKSYATQERAPDNLICIHAFNGQLWLFGQRTIEVWASTVNGASPFMRQSGAVNDVGIIGYRTAAVADASICWLGDDLIVYQATGTQPKRISTYAMEQELNNYSGKASTIGYALSHTGHIQYALTFPEAGRTWVYDFATQLWHNRATDAENRRWRGQCGVRFGDFQLIGDAFSGKIWRLDHRVFTEGGLSMQRTAVLPPIYANARRAFMSSLELEIDAGLSPPVTVSMSYSDDGGRNWSVPRVATTGAVDAYKTRLHWHRLGSFRQRTLRFVIDGAGPVSLLGTMADIQTGEY